MDGEQIRTGMGAYYERRPARGDRMVNVAESRYVLHSTTDPDVFIAEIDTALSGSAGDTTMSLLQIFRLRDGEIALLRDYFAPEEVDRAEPTYERCLRLGVIVVANPLSRSLVCCSHAGSG
ncbi:nuclear transport factor 2-like protein [Sphaerisporangium aureirubrum]|uniref:SnoaL-like domain-containing protein n=1 Tax=Sphaerisporangium aureirubrum TaxID=1544736 RepID=A0ABW1NQM4_9ACTN